MGRKRVSRIPNGHGHSRSGSRDCHPRARHDGRSGNHDGVSGNTVRTRGRTSCPAQNRRARRRRRTDGSDDASLFCGLPARADKWAPLALPVELNAAANK